SSCSSWSGTSPRRASTARSTPTSRTCARSCATSGPTSTRSPPTAAWAIRSRKGYEARLPDLPSLPRDLLRLLLLRRRLDLDDAQDALPRERRGAAGRRREPAGEPGRAGDGAPRLP